MLASENNRKPLFTSFIACTLSFTFFGCKLYNDLSINFCISSQVRTIYQKQPTLLLKYVTLLLSCKVIWTCMKSKSKLRLLELNLYLLRVKVSFPLMSYCRAVCVSIPKSQICIQKIPTNEVHNNRKTNNLNSDFVEFRLLLVDGTMNKYIGWTDSGIQVDTQVEYRMTALA